MMGTVWPSVAKTFLDLGARLVLVFILLEGLASTWGVARETFDVVRRASDTSGRAQFDAELGWVSKPNLEVEDAFGPGKDIRINSQGFRALKKHSEHTPAGKVRILCSGDSFTWGDGVGNGSTWVDQLAKIDPDVETINIAQNGYGADQAYLRYRREGPRYDHQLHVFAFIGLDFDRMRDQSFFGSPKPVLQLAGEDLEVANQPLAERGRWRFWSIMALRQVFTLQFPQVLMDLYVREHAIGRQGDRTVPVDRELETLVFKLFEEVAASTQNNGSRLAVVYLPTMTDYAPDPRLDRWRETLESELGRREIVYFDLIEEFRALRPEEGDSLFIPPGSNLALLGAGHYSEEGHAYFGSLIYRNLCSVPSIARDLGSCEAVSPLDQTELTLLRVKRDTRM